LQLPKAVEDLKAERKGDVVRLTWTAPQRTTDEQGIREKGTTKICRGGCGNTVAELPFVAAEVGGKRQTWQENLTSLLSSQRTSDFVVYTVEVTNAEGRTAGSSNSATIFLAPSLPPPRDVQASLEPDAIRLRWSAASLPTDNAVRTQYLYRVLRTWQPQSGSEPITQAMGEVPAENPQPTFRDTNFEWERKYTYKVVGVTQVLARDGKLLAQFEGSDPQPLDVIAHDTFPPAAPRDVQAVFAGAVDPNQNFIDVTWSPNSENDLAGYNVYRTERHDPNPSSGGPESGSDFGYADYLKKVNTELLKTPSFRDSNVRAGMDYYYLVTAVDLRGNESPRSLPPAMEKVPAR